MGSLGQYAERALVTGVAGGVLATVQGQRFGSGFASAGLGSALNPLSGYAGDSGFAQGFVAAIVGGTVSEATGGKFANGAVTAAFAYAVGRVVGSNRSSVRDQRSRSDGWYEALSTKVKVGIFFPELRDPTLTAAMREAYLDARPEDIYSRHEEGGLWGYEDDGSIGVRRLPSGTRDGMGSLPLMPGGVYNGLRVEGMFHIHPNPRPIDEFGVVRSSAPSGGDFGVIKGAGFPGRSYIIDNMNVIYQTRGSWGIIGTREDVLGK